VDILRVNRWRRMGTWGPFIFTILALFGSPGAGWTQGVGAIVGTVQDTSGGSVSGAMVTVRSQETGATRTVTTNDNGIFRVLSLPLGPQEVKVEKSGFMPALRTGINLEVGQEAVVNVVLTLVGMNINIAVTEAIPVVNATTASISGIVDERQVKDLPLNGRSFDNLLTLNPGTINYSAMKSPNTSTSNGNTFSVAGRRTSENEILLNGIEYMGSSQLAITPGGVSGELLGIEAVREFNVQTDTYSAEYGKRAGAQVNVVTQSGTNSFHGSIFEFLRNSALDAPGFFDQGKTPAFKRNQFGAAAGGPLKKDRLFVFGNYEGFRQALAVSSLSIVPDQQARTGSLPNPGTGVYSPVAKLNPSMLPYMSFWPQPDGPSAELLVPSTTNPGIMVPSGTAFSHNNPKQSIREDFGTVRTDYHVRNSDSISGAYTIDDGNSLNPLADPLFASYTPLRLQVFSLSETHVFSPQVLNTVSVGFSRASFGLTSVPLASFPGNLSFVSGAGPGGIVVGGGATTTANGSITSAGPNNAAGVSNHRNLFTYADTVQISRGIHQIGIGVSFQRLQDNEDSASRQLGQATFSSLTTFLQGTVTSFQVVPFHTELGWRSLFGAWYVEDTIKIRHNLTLQAGIRHEFSTGWNEASGRAANYVTDAQGVLVTAPILGNSVFSKNNTSRMLNPRIGLAWDPFGNGKTAIRAGYGIYYSVIDDLAFLMNSLPPYNGAATFSGALFPSAPNPPIIPITPGVLPPPACGPGVASPCTIFAPQGIQPNAKTPAVQEWNLAIERELSPNTALRLAYVGSLGTHELLSVDLNSIPTQICSLTTCPSGGVAAFKGSVSQGTQYIPVQSRPNPFLSGGFFWMTEGNSSYNAMQVDLTHRFSRGLQFRGNYTWSKNLDINSGLTGAQANNQAQMVMDRNDLRRDWGRSALDATHQASISARYEFPFGRNQRWLNSGGAFESKLISGWQLNSIVTVLSGFPFTPLVGSNRSGDGDTRNPDRVSINPTFTGPILLRSPSRWFDPNAFSLPTPGTYGNIGRGTLTGPNLAEVDMSVFKNTALSEKFNLQFRTEIFNLLNRANFGPVNANVFSAGAVSPSAGTITTLATSARQIQFGLKLIF
jgi:Carboxypeptidase regulatory-like domain/TonB-dependent Receptor Plug Domain